MNAAIFSVSGNSLTICMSFMLSCPLLWFAEHSKIYKLGKMLYQLRGANVPELLSACLRCMMH